MPRNTVKVTRPGPWGNPFIVNPKVKPGSNAGRGYIAVPTVEDAVACFELMLGEPRMRGLRMNVRAHLHGKNLACWCKLDSPCHADVLLRVANEDARP